MSQLLKTHGREPLYMSNPGEGDDCVQRSRGGGGLRTAGEFSRRSVLAMGASMAAYRSLSVATADSPDRPNVLWLTFEDTSADQLAQYGNEHVSTPNIDQLAADGVVMDQARATSPQCSPTRSSIVAGSYATTYGTDWHRKDWPVPDEQFYLVELLRSAGYFTTNNSKTDYNTTSEGAWLPKIWDEQGGNASYASDARVDGQPFFSVFNYSGTHMSSIRSWNTDGRSHGIDPDEVTLPAFLPDLPDVRSDYAKHLETVEGYDDWVGDMISQLQDEGEYEDTIVFLFSDHGGPLPRTKGYPFDPGYRIPMIVWVPEKWRDRIDLPTGGSRSDRLIGTEDLVPSVLSLAGETVPDAAQGRDVLTSEGSPKSYQYTFRTNHGRHFYPSRALTDGTLQYVRNYVPHRPLGLRQHYQWGCPSYQTWEWNYHFNRELLPEEHHDWLEPTETEYLFDLEDDPYCTDNLADDPEYQQDLDRLRTELSARLRETNDLGLFPYTTRQREPSLYAWVRDTGYALSDLHEAAETASLGDPANVDTLAGYLTDERPAIRFWGASGFATLAQRGQLDEPPQALRDAVDDDNGEVAVAAAEALCWHGETDGPLATLVEAVDSGDWTSSNDESKVAGTAGSALEALGDVVEPAISGPLESRAAGVPDLSGSGNDARIVGDVAFVSGRDGQGVSVDGDGYLTADTSDTFDLREPPFTVELWVNPGPHQDSYEPYFGRARDGGGSFVIQRWPDSREAVIAVATQAQAAPDSWVSAQMPVPDDWVGNWHHLAAVYDGSEVRLYVDGQQRDAASQSGTLHESSYPVGIGHNGAKSRSTPPGTVIDSVRVYDAALPVSELGYDAPDRTPAETSADVLWLDFEETTSVETPPLEERTDRWQVRSVLVDHQELPYDALYPDQEMPQAGFGPVDGLAAYYPFDTGALDVSGHGLGGTLVDGATITDEAARSGSGCLELDGAGARVDLPGTTGDETFFVEGFDARTVSAWIDPQTTDGSQVVYEEGGDADGFGLRIVDGDLEAVVANGTGDAGRGSVRGAVGTTSGGWTHAVAAFDAGEIQLYANGVAVGSGPVGPDTVPARSGPAAIGNTRGESVFGSGDAFAGRIDEVTLFERALAPGEVRTLSGVQEVTDLTGDGEVTRSDLEAYADRLDDPEFRERLAAFDYNDDGRIDHGDLVELFEEIEP